MTSSNRGNNNGRSEPISVDDICIGGSGIKGNEGTSLFYNHIDSSNFFDVNYLASVYSDNIEPFLQKGCKFFLYNQETNRYDFIPLQSEDDQNKLANVIRDIVLSKYNEFWDFVYKAAGSLDVGTNPSEPANDEAQVAHQDISWENQEEAKKRHEVRKAQIDELRLEYCIILSFVETQN